MPGIPLAAQGNIHSGNSDQMRRQNPEAALSAEEEIGSEEGLSVYCKPLEVYNILQRRAKQNPLFLQRCLRYKIDAKHRKRLQMTISLSGVPMDGLQIHPFFPVYVVLARRVADVLDTECPAVFSYTKICILRGSSISERKISEASFILPEMNKLAEEAVSGSHYVLFISCAETNSFCESNMSMDSSEAMLYSSINGKHCLWGKFPLESLFLSWERSLNLQLKGKAEMTLPLHLSYSIFKCAFYNDEGYISIQPSFGANNLANMMQVQVAISAQELGTKENSAFNLYAYNTVSSTSSQVTRLRSRNVVFNYKYCDNKLEKTEVTEDFICPFCLVGCASFEGLRCHLSSSHDLFNYEFWTTDEFQTVNVSMKCDSWTPQMIAYGVDPKLQTFSHGKRRRRRGNSKNPVLSLKDVYPPAAFASNMLGETSEILDKADDAQSSKDDMARSSSVNGSHNSLADAEAVRSGGNYAPSHMLQFAKTRKLSIEHSDHRNRALLERRHFFHSHRAQPMALEQVLSDHDSEDEVDDDVADLEDRRMLDDFIDVSKDEKQVMHLWNSFVRKQRVLADSHIPWACEAFSRLHGPDLVHSPVLVWCWRLFMIKLWNHGLLDARMMNNCYSILNRSQSDEMRYPLREDDETA